MLGDTIACVRISTLDADLLSVSDRDQILQAMADTCAREGYRETTIEAVLERAGVERETFDLQFAGKEDCALAALNKIVSECLARISMIEQAGLTPVERRKYEAKALIDLICTRTAFAHLGSIEARQVGTQAMRESYESAVRVLALMMERVGGETAAASSTMTARAALGGIEALVRRELSAGRERRLPQLIPNFVYAALVPFVGQGEALRQAKLAARMVAEEG